VKDEKDKKGKKEKRDVCKVTHSKERGFTLFQL